MDYKTEQTNRSPMVIGSLIAVALGVLLLLAFNIFAQPNRSRQLNPVGTEGTRTNAPSNTASDSLPAGT